MKQPLGCVMLMGIFISSATGQSSLSIIPAPAQLRPLEGVFEIDGNTVIDADKSVRPLAVQLTAMLSPALGYNLAVESDAPPEANCITLSLRQDLTVLGREGYQLSVTPQNISMPTDAG